MSKLTSEERKAITEGIIDALEIMALIDELNFLRTELLKVKGLGERIDLRPLSAASKKLKSIARDRVDCVPIDELFNSVMAVGRKNQEEA